MKQWIDRTPPAGLDAGPRAGDPALLERLGVSATLLRLLRLRGMDEAAAIDAFLTPNLRLLSPPERWAGLPEAAQTLCTAIMEGKKLAIWGDYDVDGITATALALDVLEHHKVPVTFHLPDRMSEGYGLNLAGIDALADAGVAALLTVDCGISNVDAVAHARERGMTVVISDHHLPPPDLPPAHAICNPRMGDNPCPHLAGVGVCFYLMAALNTLLAPHTGLRFDMREVLDLVTLGTLADMVRLSGENRILVKNGLLKVAEARRPGLAALKAVCKYAFNATLGAGQVVFTLAPRINAAGRMGMPDTALQLLRSRSLHEAEGLADKLDAMNTERRLEEERIFNEAREQAQNSTGRMGLVLYGAGWHSGIIGIVASRIVEEFHKPTLILCDDARGGDLPPEAMADAETALVSADTPSNTPAATPARRIKGSGRSVPEFDLFAALTALSDLFYGYGGHRLAAGMSLPPENLDALRERFDQVVRAALGDTPVTPTLLIDGELNFAQASDTTFLRELEMLQPFGTGNAEPVFASPPLKVVNRRPLGHSGEHVILDLQDTTTGVRLSAKAWRMAGQLPPTVQGRHIRLAYTPRIDSYRGDSIDIRIKDWQECNAPQP